MDPQARVRQTFEESVRAKRDTVDTLAPTIVRAAERALECVRDGHTLFCCGNGGSAADSQHLASELVNRFETDRMALPAIALTTDTSALTSIANDFSFAHIFARQLQALGRPGDALLAISTSGTSDNIVNAVDAAHQRGMTVIALSGRDGGAVAARLNEGDVEVRVPAHSTARIQEVHILIIHCLCDLIDRWLVGGGEA